MKDKIKNMRRYGYDTIVQCKKCGKTQYLRFDNGLKNGWSRCCGHTMPIIHMPEDIEKAVRELEKKELKAE